MTDRYIVVLEDSGSTLPVLGQSGEELLCTKSGTMPVMSDRQRWRTRIQRFLPNDYFNPAAWQLVEAVTVEEGNYTYPAGLTRPVRIKNTFLGLDYTKNVLGRNETVQTFNNSSGYVRFYFAGNDYLFDNGNNILGMRPRLDFQDVTLEYISYFEEQGYVKSNGEHVWPETMPNNWIVSSPVYSSFPDQYTPDGCYSVQTVEVPASNEYYEGLLPCGRKFMNGFLRWSVIKNGVRKTICVKKINRTGVLRPDYFHTPIVRFYNSSDPRTFRLDWAQDENSFTENPRSITPVCRSNIIQSAYSHIGDLSVISEQKPIEYSAPTIPASYADCEVINYQYYPAGPYPEVETRFYIDENDVHFSKYQNDKIKYFLVFGPFEYRGQYWYVAFNISHRWKQNTSSKKFPKNYDYYNYDYEGNQIYHYYSFTYGTFNNDSDRAMAGLNQARHIFGIYGASDNFFGYCNRKYGNIYYGLVPYQLFEHLMNQAGSSGGSGS